MQVLGRMLGGGAEVRRRRPFANFADPTCANRATALTNFCFLAQFGMATPGFAYYSTVVDMSDTFAFYGISDEPLLIAALAASTVVQSTADMGAVSIPKSYRQAVTSPTHADYWIEAINKELTGLIKLNTWTLIPITDLPPGANVMHCHYVLTVKRKSDGTVEKFKARLVADGNTQKYLVDFDPVFSSVVKPTTIRLALIVAAAQDYNIHQIDIRQAYLQAELKEELFMRVPPGVPAFDRQGRPLVCKLNRSLYGCKQSGRL